MKVDRINTNLRYRYTQFQNNTSGKKQVPEAITKDLFIQNRKDVSFNGTLGGTLGAVSGELIALKSMDFISGASVAGMVAIFFALTAGLGFLGSFVEDKIDKKQEVKNQKK